MRSLSIAFLVQACLLVTSVLCYDEISNFCARWDHQSVVKNGYLYIDGGNELFESTSSNGTKGKPYVLGINQELIQVDLTASWDWKTNISVIGIPKTANQATGTSPYNLIRGGLYSGSEQDSKVYVLGGTWSQLNNSFASESIQPSTYSLWSYDTSNQAWDQYDISADAPQRASYGSYVEAPDQGLGFYFNGQLDNGSSVKTYGFGGQTVGLQGMIMLNMSVESGPLARNLSTSSVETNSASVSSELVYIDQIGEKGILLEMGGSIISTTVPAKQNGTLATFDSVNVFDIASAYNGDGAWYKQTTTGTIPPARIGSCSVMVPAPDNSSYNIYIYGGWDPTTKPQATLYDDMYILSLPSFTWTKIYSGESPRFGHTCHLVGNRQLLTVGGSLSSYVTRECDWEAKGVAILDLTTKIWGSVYNADAAPYQVTSDLLPVIGGSASGGATMKQPNGGFSDPNLEALFTTQRSTNTTSGSAPTSSLYPAVEESNSKHVSGGVIAGAVIGAVAVVAIIAGLIFFFLRRRRQRAVQLPDQPHDAPPSYEKDTEAHHEMMAKSSPAELADAKHTPELAAVEPIYEMSGRESATSDRHINRAELETP